MKKLQKKSAIAILCTIMIGLFLIGGCKKDNPVTSGGGIEGPVDMEYWECIPMSEITITLSVVENIAHIKTNPHDLHSVAPEWMFLLQDDTQYIIHEDTLCLIEDKMRCEYSGFAKTMLSSDCMKLEHYGPEWGYAGLVSTYIFNRKNLTE